MTYFPTATFYRAEVRPVIDTSGGIVDYSRIELTYNYDDTFTRESIQDSYNYTTNTLTWIGGSDPYLTLSSATVLSDGRVQIQYTLNPDEGFVITSGEPYLIVTTQNTTFYITPKTTMVLATTGP